MLNPDVRKELLTRRIEDEQRRGSRLVWRGEFSALLGHGWRVNVSAVAMLALITGPLWLLVMGVVWANRERFRIVTVDDLGLVRTEPA